MQKARVPDTSGTNTPPSHIAKAPTPSPGSCSCRPRIIPYPSARISPDSSLVETFSQPPPPPLSCLHPPSSLPSASRPASSSSAVRASRSSPSGIIAPTASHAGPSTDRRPAAAVAKHAIPAAAPASSAPEPDSSSPPVTTANPRIPSPSFQPTYPSPAPLSSNSSEPQVRVTTPTRWSLRNAFIGGSNPPFSTPFSRSRSGTANSSSSRVGRPNASRLWNPTNSTPRLLRPRHQQQEDPYLSGEAPVPVPLSHPILGPHSPIPGAEGGDHPLLTLPEQRQKRHSASTRASLQVERSASSTGTNRISLPRSVSIEISRKSFTSQHSPGLAPPGPKIDKGKGRAVDDEFVDIDLEAGHGERDRTGLGLRQRARSISKLPRGAVVAGLSFHHEDRGKGRALTTMSTDIERGMPFIPGIGSSLNPNIPNNSSNHSLDGIGPALSSANTSIIGDEVPANNAEEWGPQHPCFPHMNPHVPIDSPLYQSTRIIRIHRDWMLEGDLAPTFSNLYPEILDPAGVSEQDFRRLVDQINKTLVPVFNPWSFRNILDGFLGLITGWVWDDLGFSAVKSRLQSLEAFLEEWNKDMREKSKDIGPENAPKIVSLRRTGYMHLDIQVPDPEISYPVSTTDAGRTGTGRSSKD
ncbi:Golgin subfamily A member 7/ERF4 family-domain-containing protein [Xylogone sp. PMI_703]|nr:Golgin subfamily A member 7/ERF4 family-domain-containing protein [Xylogone sp. PMI_703]